MKVIVALVLLCAACAYALPVDDTDVASLLANEPPAASEHRFAEIRAPGSGSDVITFSENSAGSLAGSAGSSSEDSEFDGQIAQVEEDIKKVKAQIKESQECAHRLSDQRAALKALNEQRDNLEKEKQKVILQAKLDKQMRDLSEINKMSRALRAKFTELKKTQALIKQKLTGTKSSLNQLDGNSDLSMGDINENSKDIVGEVDAIHKSQTDLLSRTQTSNSKTLKKEIDTATKINLKGRSKEESGAGDDV